MVSLRLSMSRLTYYSLVLLFYTPWKQKAFRLSDVFRGNRKATPGCNGLMVEKVFQRTVHLQSWGNRVSNDKLTQYQKPQLHIGLSELRKLCLNLRSQRWSEKSRNIAKHFNAILLMEPCVCILFHLLVSSGCTTSVTYMRCSDQRSFIVSIIRGICQVPSSSFPNHHISPPKT